MQTADWQLLLPRILGTNVGESVTDHHRRDKKATFEYTVKLVLRLKKRGYFDKPWILISVNIGNYHWIVVGLLGCSNLGKGPIQSITAYFVYDSLKEHLTRKDEITILHNTGIINFIVAANLYIDAPKLPDRVDLCQLLIDPEHGFIMLQRIKIPTCYYILQKDGHNCGLYCWMCIYEMCFIHAHAYQSMDDFDVTHFK
jgi:hypothetical protein